MNALHGAHPSAQVTEESGGRDSSGEPVDVAFNVDRTHLRELKR